MRILSVSIFAGGLAALASPVFAQDTVIEIDNGLYAFSSGLTVNGQNMLQKDYEYCLTDKHTKRSLSELVNELSGDGECDVTNIQVGMGRGSADVSCFIEEFGAKATGVVEADYSRTHYNVNTVSRVGGAIDMRTNVKARLVGDCPTGWTPPPGISDE